MNPQEFQPFNSFKESLNQTPEKPSPKETRLNFREIIHRAIKHFSVFERALFFGLFVIMSLSAGILLLRVNSIFTDEIPVAGGSIHEGVIGSARYINPVIAISDSDRDLTALIYSGLTRTLSNGEVIPDLASNFEMSEDGKTYTFTIRDDAVFQDGNKVTADDVEFTIQKIQDPALKSPKRANWVGVTIEKVSEKEIRFHLKQPYAPFIYNTTVGILPKHLWKDLSAEEFPFSLFNFEPIGSGPYKIDSITRTAAGLPQSYNLIPFKDFTLGNPYLQQIVISFYPNEDALFEAYGQGDIDSVHSVDSEHLKTLPMEESKIVTATLPRIFGVFFNQNHAPIFLDSAVRSALEKSTDRNNLVTEVLGGFGKPIRGPLPFEFEGTANNQDNSPSIDEAKAILEKAGWKYNETEHVLEKITKKGKTTERQVLAFSIATANAPELKKTAALLKESWEKLGARVDVEIFELGDLNQNIIRPRKYDALLFGEIIGRDMDLYAFWHSSQRNDPGLNVAMYANSKTDALLEEARSLVDNEKRIEKYRLFADELKKDTPAVFLYSPQFIYLLPNTIKHNELIELTIPSDRFAESYRWYVDTERVWKIFNKK